MLRRNFRNLLWSRLNSNSYVYAKLINKKKIGSAKSRLRNMLSYAIRNVPYYSNVDNASIEFFPIIDKKILLKNFEKLKSISYKGKKFLTYSGGSTGQPVPILHCNEYLDWSNASIYNYFNSYFPNNWQNARTLEIWGSDQDLKNKSGNKFKKIIKENIYGSYFINCFVMDEDKIIECIEVINKCKPYFLKGYMNALIILAKYIKERDIKIYTPNFILPRTEVLDKYSRELLENVFKGKVLDMYGSREVSAIAAERPEEKKNNLFVFNENYFLEVDHRNHILITNFHNYSMPIIRFDIGDEASLLSNDPDEQVLGKIKGRVCDYLKFKNCKVHSEYFTHNFYETSIYEFNVKQLKPNKIKVEYVDPYNYMNKGFEMNFKKKLVNLVKEDINIVWEKKLFLNKTDNGKFRYVIGLEEN